MRRKKPGPKKGYKQSPDHIAKRILRGESHPNWKGRYASYKACKERARVILPDLGPCERCGDRGEHRHHRDYDAWNNARGNLEVLCGPCHRWEHWRCGDPPEVRRRQLAETRQLEARHVLP